MRGKDKALVWISILGLLFWILMLRPAPVRKAMKKMGFSWESVVKSKRKAPAKRKGRTQKGQEERKPASATGTGTE